MLTPQDSVWFLSLLQDSRSAFSRGSASFDTPRGTAQVIRSLRDWAYGPGSPPLWRGPFQLAGGSDFRSISLLRSNLKSQLVEFAFFAAAQVEIYNFPAAPSTLSFALYTCWCLAGGRCADRWGTQWSFSGCCTLTPKHSNFSCSSLAGPRPFGATLKVTSTWARLFLPWLCSFSSCC